MDAPAPNPAASPEIVAGRRRYGLLLTTTLVSVGVQGIAPPGHVQQVIVTALAGASLLLALRAAGFGRAALGPATAFAIAILVLSIVRATVGGIGDGAGRAMNAALVAFGPPVVAVGVVRELRVAGQVRIQAVMGVLSLYILLGMLFAFTFGAIDNLGGNPFFTGGQVATVSRCLYFSFITLATVGYGDLTARTDLGHTLSVFEALIGQIYLVTIVSVIVSNLGRPARRDRLLARDR